VAGLPLEQLMQRITRPDHRRKNRVRHANAGGHAFRRRRVDAHGAGKSGHAGPHVLRIDVKTRQQLIPGQVQLNLSLFLLERESDQLRPAPQR